MVVSRLPATVGSDTAKIRLAVPAKKLPSAALIKSNQLVRESKIGYRELSESSVRKPNPRRPSSFYQCFSTT